MSCKPTAIFIGVDAGPCETLEPIAQCWGATLETGFSDSTEFWIARLERVGAALMVTGTSDSANGRAIEASARIAARCSGLPLAVIEDYPGNYVAVDGGEPDLLLVESDVAIKLVLNRLGRRCPRVMAISPARYDAMRMSSALARQATRARWLAHRTSSEPAALLWIGQPETEDALATLAELLPMLQVGGWRLLFRAHPRDTGYAVGAYAVIARALGSRFVDVTSYSGKDTFALAPRLALTQFSSMVVEAGFHGIPSICILFPGAGLDRLYEKYGYCVPLACATGAVELCAAPAQLSAQLRQMVEDERVRDDLLVRFDVYFQVDTITAATSVAALETILV